MNDSAASISLVTTGVLCALATPLLSAIVCALIRDRYSWVVSFVAPLMMLVCTGSAALVFLQSWNAVPAEAAVPWFVLDGQTFEISLLINNDAAIMMLVVAVVSFLVHVYSTGYMADDQAPQRYFAMLGFFTFAMLGVVVAGNLLMLFMFWELVGFSSYMLIGHWNEKPAAADAAKRAFLLNRVGDAGFVAGLMAVWTAYGTFDIAEIVASGTPGVWPTIAGIGLFLGVAGKSAQLPLFPWLPKAMEGPTPVSALIHAATMVAAGVYLLVRVSPLFTPLVQDFIALVGVATAVAGALAALGQTDIKRILAYSTMSQLGLMVMAVGAGNPSAAMLHLLAHAFFKAGLFLAAGNVIHALHRAQHHSHAASFDVQDVRNLGGLRKALPVTFIGFIVCGSALAGLPLSGGFLSKEAILETVLNWTSGGVSWRWIIVAGAFLVSFLTPLYTFRLIWNVFMGEEKRTSSLTVVETPAVMRTPVMLLSFASIWLVWSLHPLQHDGWVFTSLGGTTSHAYPLLGPLSVAWVILAIGMAYAFRNRSINGGVLKEAFYVDTLLVRAVEQPFLQLAERSLRADTKWIDGVVHGIAYAHTITSHVVGWIDRTLVDGVVDGIGNTVRFIGFLARRFQRGGVQLYVFWALLTIIIFIIWNLL